MIDLKIFFYWYSWRVVIFGVYDDGNVLVAVTILCYLKVGWRPV